METPIRPAQDTLDALAPGEMHGDRWMATAEPIATAYRVLPVIDDSYFGYTYTITYLGMII